MTAANGTAPKNSKYDSAVNRGGLHLTAGALKISISESSCDFRHRFYKLRTHLQNF